MKFWHMQLHEDDMENWSVDDIYEILKRKLIGCSGLPLGLFYQIKAGDIIMVRHGGVVLALVQTTSIARKVLPEEINEYIWFSDCIEIKILEYYNNLSVSGKGWFIPTTLMSVDNDIAYSFIEILYKNYKMNNIITILESKKQIILQGPPGTGKTYTAELIADQMTKAEEIESPLKIIDDYITQNVQPSVESIQLRNKLKNELDVFQEEFKKDELKDITLDKYAFGNGENDSFCWWIEYGLYELGGYTGHAGKFKIYWKKDINAYHKIGFIKDIENDDEAMSMVAKQLDMVVHEQNLKEAAGMLSNSFILKILHSYFPNKYFPINNEKCIDNALKIMGKDYKGLSVFEKNILLQKSFQERIMKYKADITSIEFMRFLFSKFNLKGSITLQNDKLLTKGEFKTIQFHPAYSYEDFVRGIVAKTSTKGHIVYEVENKVLIQFAEKALDNPSANYVLIIDEINRANLPAVLGELIYALEYRYDPESTKENSVDSMYTLKADDDDEIGSRKIRLPKNLFIIGTMNTADRSVGHIDYAIRRRFAFVNIPPSNNVINEVVSENDGIRDKAQKLYSKVEKLFTKEYLSEDFNAEQVQLGHSYFLVQTLAELDLKLEFEIQPLLKEYLNDGIFKTIKNADGKNTIAEEINNLNYNG